MFAPSVKTTFGGENTVEAQIGYPLGKRECAESSLNALLLNTFACLYLRQKISLLLVVSRQPDNV